MDSTPIVALPQFFIPLKLSYDLFVPLVFYAVAALYTVFTGVLYFHWNEYAHNKKVIAITYITYFVITLPLMLTMAVIAFLL
jgi:hypothetical protein